MSIGSPVSCATDSSSFKIGRKLSNGTSVVQRVFSSVELEVQNPTEFKKEFSAA
jgi:hypothetical protein